MPADAYSNSEMPKDSVDAGSAVEPSSKRFDKQQQLRERLIAAGIALFAKKGFDGTTVSEIAKAAGSSRRTFFRYFKTKDDVVFDWLDEQGEIICDHVSPGPTTMPPMQNLEEAMLQLARFLDADTSRARLLTHIVYDTPSLARRYQAENSRWEGEVTKRLMQGRPAKDLFQARVQVAAATATMVSAMRAWAADENEKTMRHWVRQAFRALRDGGWHDEPESAPTKRRAKS